MHDKNPREYFIAWLPPLGLFAGTVCAFYTSGPVAVSFSVLLPAFGLAACWCLRRGQPGLAHALLFLIAGFLAFQWTAATLARHCRRLPTSADLARSYQIRARVRFDWTTRYGHGLAVDRIEILSPPATPFDLERLTLYLPAMDPLPARGQSVTAWIQLRQRRQPHPIPWPMQDLQERLMPRFYGSVKHPALISFQPARQEPVAGNLNQGNRELMAAFLEGRPSRLWRERLEPFGLSHLLAISGMHCIFVFLGLQLVLLPLRRPVPRILLTAVGLAAFAAWVGWSASVTRASLMLILWLMLPSFDRRRSWLRLWSGLLLIALLADPLLLLMRGFWYSFGASLGLILGGSGARPGPLDHPWLRRLRPFLPIVSAQCFVVPINLLFGCHTRFTSLLWNMLGVVFLAVLAGLLVAVLLACLIAALVPLVNGAEQALTGLLAALDWNAPFLELQRFPLAPGWVLLLLLAMILALRFGGREWRWYLATGLLALGLSQHRPLRGARCVMIDVGQGLCILITDDDGRGFLLDAGGRLPAGLEMGRLLRLLGAERITGAAVSHANLDHYGLLEQLPPDFPVFTPPQQIAGLPREGFWAQAEIVPISAGGHLPLRLENQVLWPPAAGDPPNANEGSLTLLLRGGAWSLLFTGDAGAFMEQRVAWPQVPGTRILQVGHHGSRSATGDALVAGFKPAVGLISCGLENPFHHPHGEVVARLERAGVHTFISNRTGSLEILPDGRIRPLAAREREANAKP